MVTRVLALPVIAGSLVVGAVGIACPDTISGEYDDGRRVVTIDERE